MDLWGSISGLDRVHFSRARLGPTLFGSRENDRENVGHNAYHCLGIVPNFFIFLFSIFKLFFFCGILILETSPILMYK